MLEEVHVRDLALIAEAWMVFRPGLNVLSGETGAGKTVLVEALQLLVGERADSGLVRTGASEALVEGRFVLDGQEHPVRRRVSAEGRSRCYLDDDMATVGELAEVLGPLVDLHGQHDHQALLRPVAHAGYLERFAGDVDYSGHEQAQAYRWQAQLHLYRVPFYYVEYGIAQLGALAVWVNARRDTAKAIADYRAALAAAMNTKESGVAKTVFVLDEQSGDG